MKFIIKKQVIEAIKKFAKMKYPNEFIALLEGEKKKNSVIIKSLIYQHFHASENSALIKINPMIYINIYGTVHSHPSRNNRPSKADLDFFSKHPGIHLIISYPYKEENIKAYDNYGNEVSFEKV